MTLPFAILIYAIAMTLANLSVAAFGPERHRHQRLHPDRA